MEHATAEAEVGLMVALGNFRFQHGDLHVPGGTRGKRTGEDAVRRQIINHGSRWPHLTRGLGHACLACVGKLRNSGTRSTILRLRAVPGELNILHLFRFLSRLT